MNKPINVVITYKGKLYRNTIINYKILNDNYTIILPKYKNCQYYSLGYFKRMTQNTIKWEELEWLPK
jgi:hypothetical protein